MSSAIVSHISWAPYVKWTETVIDNCRHARFYATTRIPHQPSALGGHISSIMYIKWTKTVISNMYDKVNNTRNHCILMFVIHSSVYRRNNFTEYKIKSCTFSLKEIHPKMSSSKRPPCSLDTQCVCIRSIHRYATEVFVQHYAQANAKTTSSVLLSLCEENPSVTSEFPRKGQLMRKDVFLPWWDIPVKSNVRFYDLPHRRNSLLGLIFRWCQYFFYVTTIVSLITMRVH